ncbi:MAG: hypothetical protein AAB520_01960, partial [Patescibacteria group bacterium]
AAPLREKEEELKKRGVLGPGGIMEYIKTKKKTLAASVLAALIAGILTGGPGAFSGLLVAGGSVAGDQARNPYL